jgi:hypothetical protein
LDAFITTNSLDWRQAPHAASHLKKPWFEMPLKSSEPYFLALKGIKYSGNRYLEGLLKRLKKVGKLRTSPRYLACIQASP